jgi:small conductance mechanosensitive channel
MEAVREFLGDFGNLVQAAVVIIVVAALLGTLNRVLKGGQTTTTGNKFRNQLVMFIATFGGIILIILGMPLPDAVRGQLLTLIGILLSAAVALGGSTLLSNAMAGIMLKMVRNFRSGDFIQTGDHFGRVTERGLFHTEIQTADRDLITLPNLLLATSAVRVIRTSGTIVSATLSLGYDVHHDKIENLLTEAVEKIGLTEPFVQILDLGDYSVTYRAAGLLTETKQLIAYRSRLRGAMLDCLHEAGVEIVSPEFTNARVYQAADQFIPRTPTRKDPEVKDAAPVDVVFDKAEEAESKERLQAKLRDREAELEEVRKQLKETSDPEQQKRLETRIASMERTQEALQKAIAAAAEREKKPGT